MKEGIIIEEQKKRFARWEIQKQNILTFMA